MVALQCVAFEWSRAEEPFLTELIKGKAHTHFRVAPDGSQIALLAPHQGAMNLWLQGVGSGDRKQVTRDRRSIKEFSWQYDSKHLLYLQDTDGDQQWHLYQVDLNGFNTRDLTPFRGIQARIVSLRPLVPDQILVAMNLHDRQRHDVFRVHLQSGAIELDTRNPGSVLEWCADADLLTRAGVALSASGGYKIIIKDLNTGEWSPMVTIPAGSILPKLIGFSPDGTVLWYLGDNPSGRIQLWALNLQTGETKSTTDALPGDVVQVFQDPVLGVPEGVALMNPEISWHLFHNGYSFTIDFLKFEKGDLSFPNRSLQKKHWIVRYTDPQMSTTYQVFTLGERHKVSLLGMERPNLRNKTFSPTKPLQIPGSGGGTIRATFNPSIRPEEGPHPWVIRVADGSIDQPKMQFDEEAQWLAHKGVSVLSIFPPRGAAACYPLAGLAEGYWANDLQNDVLSARQWVVKQDQAVPEKIFVKGVGFGAYAALAAAVKQPDAFAGVVLVNGVTDIPSFMAELPIYHQSIAPALASWYMGDGKGMLSSPFDQLSNLDTPILLVHGKNNPWIRKDQAERLHMKLDQYQKPVETLFIEGEGHGFIQEENVLRYYEVLGKFLDKALSHPSH